MSVYDFCILCTDDLADVRIYDMNPAIENEVFSGTIQDATFSNWESYEVESYDLDPKDGIILNIDTSEE